MIVEPVSAAAVQQLQAVAHQQPYSLVEQRMKRIVWLRFAAHKCRLHMQRALKACWWQSLGGWLCLPIVQAGQV